MFFDLHTTFLRRILWASICAVRKILWPIVIICALEIRVATKSTNFMSIYINMKNVNTKIMLYFILFISY